MIDDFDDDDDEVEVLRVVVVVVAGLSRFQKRSKVIIQPNYPTIYQG